VEGRTAGAPVHGRTAGFASGTEVAGPRPQMNVLDLAEGRFARLATMEAVERAGRAGTSSAGIPLRQEVADITAVEQGRTSPIDRLQSAALPMAHGVLVDAQSRR
jgi:hypothetical protein